MKKEPKEEPKLYQITLTEQQCQTMTQALEAYARIGIGQIDIAIEDNTRHFHDRTKADWQERRNALDYAKRIVTGLGSGEANGIGNHRQVPDEYNVAWDMVQVIRHKISWEDQPQGGSGVHFYEPMRTSKQDFVKIERMETESERIIKKGF